MHSRSASSWRGTEVDSPLYDARAVAFEEADVQIITRPPTSPLLQTLPPLPLIARADQVRNLQSIDQAPPSKLPASDQAEVTIVVAGSKTGASDGAVDVHPSTGRSRNFLRRKR